MLGYYWFLLSLHCVGYGVFANHKFTKGNLFCLFIEAV